MMTLICSVSFRSSAATMASIVATASDEISVVSLSACAARVRTADSTASLAASDRGLNSF